MSPVGRVLVAVFLVASTGCSDEGRNDEGVAREGRWEIDLVAEGVSWRPDRISRADRGEFRITLRNRDDVPHNVHLFLVSDPEVTYQSPDVPPGEEETFDVHFSACAPCEFIYRCEIHPDRMSGTLLAERNRP
jgi:plastocyanin